MYIYVIFSVLIRPQVARFVASKYLPQKRNIIREWHMEIIDTYSKTHGNRHAVVKNQGSKHATVLEAFLIVILFL